MECSALQLHVLLIVLLTAAAAAAAAAQPSNVTFPASPPSNVTFSAAPPPSNITLSAASPLSNATVFPPVASASSLAQCQKQCGDINISYPFGIGNNSCFRPGFKLDCDNSSQPPRLFLGDSKVEVTQILLTQGQVRINNTIATMPCINGGITTTKNASWTLEKDGPYSYSGTENLFITISYGIVAFITTGENPASVIRMCASIFRSIDDINKDEPCSGIGCCQTSIPKGMQSLRVSLASILNLTSTKSTALCSKAFLVERELFRFDPSHLSDDFYNANSTVPVVLDWAIPGHQSCDVAANESSFACLSAESHCFDTGNGIGYLCSCNIGFNGNPYLFDGCHDIDECESPNRYPCFGDCKNTIGNYSCSCPKGTYSPDPTKYSCLPTRNLGEIASIGIELGVGLLIQVGVSILLYKRLKLRNIKKRRRKFFHQNRGLLLQKLITSNEDVVERTKIFTLEELEKATNNFDITRIVGRGGHGTVYKGILSDQRVVAIKKSKIAVQSEIEQFVNEVAILSQISHRNVVKLFGCCLETEVPLLVYEFISGGTLSDHLYPVGNHVTSLAFEDRIRIATEVAGALAYLHSSAFISIFHRDVKTSNILLDHNYSTKVSDFGASRTIPSDKTRITTAVQGTFGYLDPEYFHTGQLTEKSDVYSFGVILIELLTGERAISLTLLKEEKNLAMHFIESLRQNRLFEILDVRITEGGVKDDIVAVARLAEKCLSLKGEERPTMKELERKLDGLRKSKEQKYNYGTSQHKRQQQTERFIERLPRESNPIDGTRVYSLEREFMLSMKYAR